MFLRFTPTNIIKDRQSRFLAVLLILTLVLSSSYYLFTTNTANATSTYTWDQSNFSAGTTSSTTAATEVKLNSANTLTDTTPDDFRGGYSDLTNLYTIAVTEADDGEVGLANYWRYNIHTSPALYDHEYNPSYDDILIWDDYIYITDYGGGGAQVIDTKGTVDPTDDEVVFRYHPGSTPSINSIYPTNFNLVNDLLYISTYNGLSVIDTQGTANPADDTFLFNYLTSTTPAITHNFVFDSFVSGNLLYVSTFGGLFVIDTKGTVGQGDDTLEATYRTNTTPALPNNRVDITLFENDLIYTGSPSGLTVINTQGTATSTDDVLLITYNTTSEPALPYNGAYQFFIDGDLIYVGSTVIDTKGTLGPEDDEILVEYNDQFHPDLPDFSRRSQLVNDILYLTSSDLLSAIDTKGTKSIADDTVLFVRSFYNLGADIGTGPLIKDSLVYFNTYTSAVVTPLDEEYNPSATFLGLPQPLTTTPTSSISIDRTLTNDHEVDLSYRTGSVDAVWRDDFATTSSFAGDLYVWGSEFQDVSVTDGVLRLSNPTASWGAPAYFDTGYPDDYFEVGSVITARVRMTTADPDRVFRDWLFTDDWSDSSIEYNITNEWINVTLETNGPFSDIGLEPWFPDNLGWGAGDFLEIDWIQITTPDSMGEWNAWSTPCSDSVCPITPADLTGNSWIQYRLDLATTNSNTTPSVNSVTYQGPYASTGTYTSNTETFTRNQSLLTFTADTTIPTGTSITFEYSTNGTTWLPLTNNTTFPNSSTAQNFTWRATLLTTNPAITPTINSVTLTTNNYNSSKTGTSVKTRVTQLEAQGKLEEANQLKNQYPQFFVTRNTTQREIQLEIIKRAQEAVRLLEILVARRE